LKQDDHEFKDSLSYLSKILCQKKKIYLELKKQSILIQNSELKRRKRRESELKTESRMGVK
jgi:hypothetical protein